MSKQNSRTPENFGEFALIEEIFQSGNEAMLLQLPKHDQVRIKNAVLLGIGDDGALLQTDPEEALAITTDMLVSGRHFFLNANPNDLGHKALAVNLSDLAAMGAKPLGFTLAISLPEANRAWLAGFAQGLFSLAQQFACPLIGGDTTAGPLTISITAFGSVSKKHALLRSSSKVNDDIWVSGTLGDARFALGVLRQEWNDQNHELGNAEKLHRPSPRVELGIALRGIANACCDISDGLLGDLSHILQPSQVGAEIKIDSLPCSSLLQTQGLALRRQCTAAGGDDYELCFTAAADQGEKIKKISQALNLPITRVGKVIADKNAQLILLDASNKPLAANETTKLLKSFDHFKREAN